MTEQQIQEAWLKELGMIEKEYRESLKDIQDKIIKGMQNRDFIGMQYALYDLGKRIGSEKAVSWYNRAHERVNPGWGKGNQHRAEYFNTLN